MSASEFRDSENRAIFCAALTGYLASRSNDTGSEPDVDRAVSFAQAVVRRAHGGDDRSVVPDYAGLRDTATKYVKFTDDLPY